MTDQILVPFDSWADAQAWVAKHGFLYYHAPLDYRPVRVKAAVRASGIRIEPADREADPFVATRDHLSRMRGPLPRS